MADRAAEVRLDLIPPSAVLPLWGWFGHHLEKICELSRGEIRKDILQQKAQSGDIWIWVASNVETKAAIAALAAILEDRDGVLTAKTIGLVSDHSKSWRTLNHDWEDDLKARGVRRIAMIGRPGFGRLFGYTPTGHVVMEKDLA